MKKHINAILMASLISTPVIAYAEESLFNPYASIRVQLQDDSEDTLEYKDNFSRLGAYGGTMITDTIKATYNVEFRLSTGDGSFAGNDSRARLANIGFEGSFGSLLIGKQYSPLWNYTDNAIDILSDVDESAGCTHESTGVICHTHRFGLFGQDEAGNNHYVELLRPDRAITYTTPELGGFQLAAMAVLNNGDIKANAAGTDNEKLVGYNVAVKYAIGNIVLSASRFDVTAFQGENKVDALQLAYNHGQWSLAAHYQKSNDQRFYQGAEIVEEKVMELYAGYQFNTLKLQGTFADVALDAPSGLTVDANRMTIDLVYPHKKGSFYIQYNTWGSEAEETFDATDLLAIGYRLDL